VVCGNLESKEAVAACRNEADARTDLGQHAEARRPRRTGRNITCNRSLGLLGSGRRIA
jgi:hypothetical protein